MCASIIFKQGRVVDPVGKTDEIRDLAVQDGVIVPPEAVEEKEAQIIDLTGAVICPGFIDMHVHLRDPGQTNREDIVTGTKAAARGGFTTVLAMPNTHPVIDSRAHLEDVIGRIKRHAQVRVIQSAALTRNLDGENLTNPEELLAAGAGALTDDGGCIQRSALMLRAMREAGACGIAVIDHAEDMETAGQGALHDGEAARKLGLPGKPRCSEELTVARDLVLARETGCPVHIQHVSSAGSVALIRTARSWGLPVTGEVTPHHLSLTEDACLLYGTNAKMNPPLRTEEDRMALIDAVVDGTLSVIATDHAPHTELDKAQSFRNAPCGIVGLETAVSVCFTELYHKAQMPLIDLVARFTQGPRDLLKLPYGSLSWGAPADITILDPDMETVVDTNSFASKSRNCPYHGWHCKGAVLGTIVAGKWVYSENMPRL